MVAYKLTAFLRFICALFICGVILLPVCLLSFSPFPFEREKEYYLYSLSSQANIVNEPALLDLLFVTGESARIKTEEIKLETPEDSETGEDLYYEEPEVIVEVAIVDAFGEREIIFQRDYSAETGTGAETVD